MHILHSLLIFFWQFDNIFRESWRNHQCLLSYFTQSLDSLQFYSCQDLRKFTVNTFPLTSVTKMISRLRDRHYLHFTGQLATPDLQEGFLCRQLKLIPFRDKSSFGLSVYNYYNQNLSEFSQHLVNPCLWRMDKGMLNLLTATPIYFIQYLICIIMHILQAQN